MHTHTLSCLYCLKMFLRLSLFFVSFLNGHNTGLRCLLWCCVSFFFFFNWRLITLQYCGGFCHTFTWISHGCTCVPHPETPSHIPPDAIPQGGPSGLALSALFHASNLDWWSISHMVIYMLEKEMATHSSVLAWRIPGVGEPCGLPSMGSHRVGHDWSDVAAIYMFQSYSLKSSHPRLHPQSPKVCSLCLCLFCCLTYRVIATIFLHSIYMC